MPIQSLLIKKEITYTGKELSPHWIYRNFQLLGDAIVAFRGPCRVEGDDLVDEVDRQNGDLIHSEMMLHFIVEHFSLPLSEMVLRQRLLICLIHERLNRETSRVKRKGDDLFFKKRKLSVSIATKSAVSCLIHVGLNISSKNTPLPTANLIELKVKPAHFAFKVMNDYKSELDSLHEAICKVRGV